MPVLLDPFHCLVTDMLLERKVYFLRLTQVTASTDSDAHLQDEWVVSLLPTGPCAHAVK